MTILWPPFVGWMFFCSLLFRILSRTRVIIQQEDGTEQKQYHRMLENINYNLKKIGEMTGLKMPLTTYTARHTWASIARDMDIPIPIISEGMGHNSIKTTQVYLNSIDVSKINEANKKIIRKISKK